MMGLYVHCLVVYVTVMEEKHVFCRMMRLCLGSLVPYVIVIEEKHYLAG